ncbi:MAG: 2Fe-2S iron-sulfur cluster-binding protein [Acidimicrobiaceae bacterium]|nr:2Fe-2S iron-sulfur cluster-binding protein [Acidimicrobiaceae bacterium]MCY4279968.1 2Fe-2S iron-sulfur cluster-binding protein [Acidimicrobiaceae bacterium]MCY4294421.1 2Fe-2S iron-sulfur cluster-binding protein [Acidimicrobiaceae bacterium]
MPRIHFKTAGRYVDFADGEEVNVLRMAIREDVEVPWQCASGNCGTDRLVVEEGAENLDPPRRRERARLGELVDQGYRLACQTYTRGDVTFSWDPDQAGLDESASDGDGGESSSAGRGRGAARSGWAGSGSG